MTFCVIGSDDTEAIFFHPFQRTLLSVIPFESQQLK